MISKLSRLMVAFLCLVWAYPAAAQGFSHTPASAVWSFNSDTDYENVTATPENGFAVTSVDLGDTTISGTGTGTEDAIDANGDKVTFIKIKPVNGATDRVEWYVKPTQGVTFTPGKIAMYIQRFGTDAKNGVTISAKAGEGEEITLGNFTAPRNNKPKADDKFGTLENYGSHVVIELTPEQQTALASTDGFYLYATIGVNVGKEGGFSDIHIEGYLDGSAPSVKVENEAGNITWYLDNETAYTEPNVINPEDYFSIASFNINDATVTGTATGNDETIDANGDKIRFLKVKPANGTSDVVEWYIKPSQGLSFTPTKIDMYIQRFGTDAQNGVTVSAKAGEMEAVTLGNFTAPRNNRLKADDKFGTNENYGSHVVIELTPEQQTALTSGEGLHLYSTIGVSNTKEAGFANVNIVGVLNGELIKVTKYTLTLAANPAGAATVSVRPSASEFEAGTKVAISAERNFGYKFVNWTDAAGKVISETPDFDFTMDADAVLTANYDAISTYSLNYGVEGGANPYMVQPTPAPVVVDGKNMYEEGTNVTLIASSNPIVTFNNWSDGQTSAEISLLMDADKTVTANYSAIDYVVGWDFYRPGSNGRVADFHSADNDATALTLRNSEGTTEGWLDKNQETAGGYEGRPAAVNWRTYGLGEYYWEAKINASSFTDMQLITAMCYNYNAYTVQKVEYSLDGTNWASIGNITLEGAKNWIDATFDLPAEANNCATLYIRWISDKSSKVDGTESKNDGIALGATFLTGKEKPVDDGKAPVLLSAVPEEGSETASINGKIVLTFDEKIKVADNAEADLNGLKIAPEVSGKTLLFPYKNLAYGTKYTFSLPANSVSDLTDNAISEAITISFTTRTRPTVAKGGFDFIVPDDGTIHEAIAAAEKRDDTTKRFRIFIRNGEYKLPASTTNKKTDQNGKGEFSDPTTYVNTPNVSFIGESVEGVVITNTLPDVKGALEGIGIGDVLDLNAAATGTYFQNLTLKSSMGDKNGRDIVLNDKSDKTICKDICLWGYQDTYVSNNSNSRYYFEGGLLRGRTDFLCGKGDVFYNAVTLQMVGAGYLAVPSVPKKYGYIFKDCEIVGETDKADNNTEPDGKYTLGRPWGSGTPIALFIDTKMNIIPSATGWNDMGSDGYPARFAEYNSHTSAGTTIDLSQRKKSFGPGKHPNNPVLTKEEAEAMSYETVMGGDDDWNPAALAEQAPTAENIVFDGLSMIWDDNDYVLCWAVCEDGKVVAFTTEPSYTITNPGAKYTLRSVNEMGGLGEEVDENGSVSGLEQAVTGSEIVSTVYYNLEGMRVDSSCSGILIKVDTLADGNVVTSKIMK